MDTTIMENGSNGSSKSQLTKTLGPLFKVCQLNTEGISDYLSKLLLDHNIDVVLLQETHTSDESQLRKRRKIHGYRLIGATYHPYARATLEDVKLISTSQDDDISAVTVKVVDTLLTNVYKPPAAIWPDNILPTGDHSSIYARDFNSQHTQRRYSQNNQNGTKLVDWAEAHNIQLVFSAKHGGTFHSDGVPRPMLRGI